MSKDQKPQAILGKLANLNDICLFVQDMDKSIDFYQNKLNFRIIRQQPVYTDEFGNPLEEEMIGYVEFDFNGTNLTLWRETGVYRALKKEFLGEKGNHFMLAVKVDSFQEVDDICSELVKNGVELLTEAITYEWGSRAVYFKDPDNNIWEVFAWQEGSGPGLKQE